MSLSKTKILLPVFLLFSLLAVKAQDANKMRTQYFVVDTTVLRLDSLSIIPSSFQITGAQADDYRLDWITSTLYITNSELIGKPMSCTYSVFTIDLSKKQFHKSPDIISHKQSLYFPPSDNQIWSNRSDHDEGSMLTSTGSIARGFSIGNNQDFVLTSSLNLQLSGMLAKDLEVKANITDKNLPIQPEGNTRLIQDFDKIFISLNYKNQWMLNAGDLDIKIIPNYFLVMEKRTLGMEMTANNNIGQKFKLVNRFGGGISKGKFYRQKLNVVNGMQGPYRLTGEMLNTHIVILSGSERVYIDNKLMTRGLDNDYVIDYNTGEITFTARILITSEKEINVEYQYTDLSYSRYSLYSFNQFTSEKDPKLKLTFNFFHEQDMKEKAIQPLLNDSMKLFLSTLGNQTQAYYPSADTSSYHPNEILYMKIDTVVQGENFSPVYIYSNNSNEQLYRLSFSYLGEGKGNYQLAINGTNGRVFQWVAPIDGIPQGAYEPVILLTPPKLTQWANIGGEYFFTENIGISTEFAFSNYNVNTFAPANNKENLGFAYKARFFNKNKLPVKNDEKTAWFFNSDISYEYLHRNFKIMESFRNVEFYKDYNLKNDFSPNKAEQMAQLLVGFTQEKTGEIRAKVNYYSREKELKALRNELFSTTKWKGFQLMVNHSFLLSDDSLQTSRYYRAYNLLSKQFKKIELGVYERFEWNHFADKKTDTLLAPSFKYNEIYIYLKNNDTTGYIYNFLIKNILEEHPFAGKFKRDHIATEAQFSFEIAKWKNNRLKGTATFRNSQQLNEMLKFFSENFFIGSLEYMGRYFKNAVILNTYYEMGSGLEQKRIYTFLKVADGQGTHIWIDYNQNGIEELNEFEVAVFQNEANYIKIWITSQEYINTYNNQFTQSIQLRPANVWLKKSGFLRFLARFQNVTTLRAGQKNSLKNIGKAMNPFLFNLNDTALISSTANFSNLLSFNQLSPYWGIDYSYRLVQNKNMLFYGVETQKLESQEFLIKGNPQKYLTLKVSYTSSSKSTGSAYFLAKNYLISSNIIKSYILLQHKNMLYWNILYAYQNKTNKKGMEKCIENDAELEMTYRMSNKGMLNVKVQYAFIHFNGLEISNIGYELLEGLRKGHNALWSVSFQTKITDFLQVDLQYNGRISQFSKMIHTGTVQLKAFF